MHKIAYIYLLIKRSSFPFPKIYMAGFGCRFRMERSDNGKLITTYNALLKCHTRPEPNRPTSPFLSKLLHQIKYFTPCRYWHCNTNEFRQKSGIIGYQLTRYIQPPDMVLSELTRLDSWFQESSITGRCM